MFGDDDSTLFLNYYSIMLRLFPLYEYKETRSAS